MAVILRSIGILPRMHTLKYLPRRNISALIGSAIAFVEDNANVINRILDEIKKFSFDDNSRKSHY